jgi:5-bromo-4-chloroindolyl phosphate hydrolysis protein
MGLYRKATGALFHVLAVIFIVLLVVCDVFTVAFAFQSNFLVGSIVFVVFSCLLMMTILLLSINKNLKEMKVELSEFAETQGKDESAAMRHMKDAHRETIQDFRRAMEVVHEDLKRIEKALEKNTSGKV